VGAVASYALLRLVQKLFLTEPDPALVFYSEHAGFFWRAWTAAYAGGTFAFLGWLAARRPGGEERTARVLSQAVLGAFVLVVVQSACAP
jgi:hypothetical protein